MNFVKTALPRDFIFEFQGDEDLVTNYYQEVVNSKKLKYKPISNNIEYAYPILKNDELINWMTSCLNEIGNLYFENVNLKINDIWLIKSNFLSAGKPHVHSLSIFSGLLYLDNHETQTLFSVEDEFHKRYLEFYNIIFKNSNTHKLAVKPKVGKLIIWPSYLYHRIDAVKTKSIRYTLAFNSFFDGKVSDNPTTQLFLNTKNPDFI